ncbi:putative non-LTR retroelement reverse transcriptase-like [Trifolium medium]|uniref:Putative non-LTR retroelement reverse transcriptase-like n=1 Tax=Trifolium medium TaxID=97028 RepID=A0A392TZE9_9FABA|nr:putative non-LTR retroelement reverse transcriptase-like [Trifolium medium]
MDLDWEVKMSHVYREENFCADGLAEISFDLSDEIVIFDSCPVAIRERYFANVSGPRLAIL